MLRRCEQFEISIDLEGTVVIAQERVSMDDALIVIHWQQIDLLISWLQEAKAYQDCIDAKKEALEEAESDDEASE